MKTINFIGNFKIEVKNIEYYLNDTIKKKTIPSDVTIDQDTKEIVIPNGKVLNRTEWVSVVSEKGSPFSVGYEDIVSIKTF